MQSTAAAMISSPRHAPAGAADSPDASAAATPSTAIETPIDFRIVNGSMPSTAPTTMVKSGSVASARLARAAVV